MGEGSSEDIKYCPSCGDSDNFEDFAATETGSTVWRCKTCDRLFLIREVTGRILIKIVEK